MMEKDIHKFNIDILNSLDWTIENGYLRETLHMNLI